MKIKYKDICKEILEIAKTQNKDVRVVMREWIVFFETQAVNKWDRDKLFEHIIQCKKEEEEK